MDIKCNNIVIDLNNTTPYINPLQVYAYFNNKKLCD